MNLDSIKSSPLFHELYDGEVEKILSNCDVVKFNPGDLVIEEGEEGSELFIILSGRVEIRKKNIDRLLAVLSPGDVFGEMVLINETKRTSDAYAQGECEILLIKSENVFNLFQRDAKIFSILIFNMARLLVKRLKQSDERMAKLASS